jgi:hypothetical protein
MTSKHTPIAPFLAPTRARKRPSPRTFSGQRTGKPPVGGSAPANLFSVTGGNGQPAPPGAGVLSQYVSQKQVEPSWCWAAVSSAVSRFYGNDFSQYDVAAMLIDPSCRTNSSSKQCNSEQKLDIALDRVKHLAPGNGYGGYHMGPGACLPDDLISDICNLQRPICCHITWSGVVGNGERDHYVVISGYEPATKEVRVEDSRDGSTNWLPYSELVNAFDGQGHWDYTYWTTP